MFGSIKYRYLHHTHDVVRPYLEPMCIWHGSNCPRSPRALIEITRMNWANAKKQLSNRWKKRRTAKKIIENRFEMCHRVHVLAWNTVVPSPAHYMCSCSFVCEWTIYDNVGIVWNMGEFPQNATRNSCTRHVYKLTGRAGRRRTVNARPSEPKNQSLSACMRCVESANGMEQGRDGEHRRNINKSQLIAFDSVRIYRLLINAFACVRISFIFFFCFAAKSSVGICWGIDLVSKW